MKKINVWLKAAFCILLAGYVLTDACKVSVRTPDYEQKIAAATLAEECFSAVKQLKLDMGIPLNTASDINETGLIGQDYSLITTTLGDLPSKRTSTNPNMAALVVDMFNELELQPGDKIAVNCSGSFPALNIAVLCAAEVLELDPFMISSFGASTHGANDPELTYLDMEYYLYENGYLSNKSDYFSIGGNLDIGTDMNAELTAEIVARLKADGYPFIYDEDLFHNIEHRYALYNEGAPVKCFVNVGGNDASFGDSIVMVHAAGGILTELSERDNSIGLVQLYLKDNIPVVHLLNLKGMVADYGMPFDPAPLPKVGDGGVYYDYEYNKPLAAGVLFIALCFLLKLWHDERAAHLRALKEEAI